MSPTYDPNPRVVRDPNVAYDPNFNLDPNIDPNLPYDQRAGVPPVVEPRVVVDPPTAAQLTALLVAIRRIAPGSARRVVEIIDAFALHYYPDGWPEVTPPTTPEPPTPQVVNVTVTAAQMLALDTAPVLLVEAPAAGSALEFLGATVHYTFGTLPYVVGLSELTIRQMTPPSTMGGTMAVPLACAGLLDLSVNGEGTITPTSPAIAEEGNFYAVAIISGALLAGDGTITVDFNYQVVPATMRSLDPLSIPPYKFGVA